MSFRDLTPEKQEEFLVNIAKIFGSKTAENIKSQLDKKNRVQQPAQPAQPTQG